MRSYLFKQYLYLKHKVQYVYFKQIKTRLTFGLIYYAQSVWKVSN